MTSNENLARHSARVLNGILCVAGFGFSAPALGAVNLELRPAAQNVGIGCPINIGLYAVSDSANNQLMSAVQVIINWDQASLHLLTPDNTGAPPWLSWGFSSDPYHLN